MSTQILQGDELILVRRRTITTIDPETRKETSSVSQVELSIVRVPQDFHILGGGSMEPEHVSDDKNENRDRHYLTIRYPIRL